MKTYQILMFNNNTGRICIIEDFHAVGKMTLKDRLIELQSCYCKEGDRSIYSLSTFKDDRGHMCDVAMASSYANEVFMAILR